MNSKASNGYVISIDLGGTKILSALVNAEAEILFKTKISTNAGKGRPALIKSLVDSVNSVLAESKTPKNKIKAICIGIPGSVDPVKGKISVAPNLKISNFLIRDALKKYFSIPIYIENDVNLAALGIMRFESNDNWKNALVVYVGTGVGGALFFDGHLYHGSGFFAGEIGHIKVDDSSNVCGCGKKGCLETAASRTAIVREIQKEMRKGKKSVLKEIVPAGKPIKSKALAFAVKRKDKLVIKHVTNACHVLGTTLSNITNLLNLDTIIIGGGVTEALGSFMLPRIKESFNKNVLKDVSKSVKIYSTKLGDDAALLGGLALYEEYRNSK